MSKQGRTPVVKQRNPIAKAMQDTLVYRTRKEADKRRDKQRSQSRDAKRFFAE